MCYYFVGGKENKDGARIGHRGAYWAQGAYWVQFRKTKKGRVLVTGARIGYNLGNLNEEWAFKLLFRCILIAKIANISAYSAKKTVENVQKY